MTKRKPKVKTKMQNRPRHPTFSQVHVTGRAGLVHLTAGNKVVTLSPEQADRVGMELIRRADVARVLYRMATGIVR